MYKRILMAYNGTREGKAALLACTEIAAFAKAETHLLAVASMPSSMFLTEGFLPEELIEEEKKRMQGVLDEGLSTLKEREAKILRLYFGLDGREPMTLEEIGSLLGITRERVRQIKEKALSRLRHISKARALESFLG